MTFLQAFKTRLGYDPNLLSRGSQRPRSGSAGVILTRSAEAPEEGMGARAAAAEVITGDWALSASLSAGGSTH